MATVNKSSLRAEFDALKARFESLCAAGKMSADSRALFDALLMLFEVLMAVFMEKHTPKSSANSSLPASQSPNDETARTHPGAKGKGPSYNGERCANTRTREYVKVLTLGADSIYGYAAVARAHGVDFFADPKVGPELRNLAEATLEGAVDYEKFVSKGTRGKNHSKDPKDARLHMHQLAVSLPTFINEEFGIEVQLQPSTIDFLAVNGSIGSSDSTPAATTRADPDSRQPDSGLPSKTRGSRALRSTLPKSCDRIPIRSHRTVTVSRFIGS